ncbi:MAG: DUF4340 domain-containing protein [Verrucomicrobia bacterium]|nr:DUF4340 domain-containing protein [Verrucomicrobiota bacterium]
MNRAATLLLLLAATVAVVLVLTTEQFRTSPEWKLQPGSQMFDPDEEKISEIRLQNGERSVVLVKRGDKWVFAGAVEDDASPEAVRAIFRAAAETMVFDRIDGEELSDEKSRAAYGVLKSGVMFDFNNDRPNRLFFGKTAADPSRVYASFQGSDTVYLVSDGLLRFAMLPPDNFRDRRLAPNDPEGVRRIEIRQGTTALELENNGRGWRITKPLNAPADNEAVADLLKKLADLRLASFDTPSNGGDRSGDPFEQTSEIRIFGGDSETPATISIGKPASDGFVPVRLQPRNISGTAPPALAEAAAIQLDRLRDRSLARLNPDLVDLIRWHDGGIKTDICRVEGSWSGAMEGFFKSLSETKASRYAAATPAGLAAASLDPPVSRLEFLSVLSENTPEALAGEHPVLSLAIGATQPDGTLPVHIGGAPEIAFVPGSFLNRLPAE